MINFRYPVSNFARDTLAEFEKEPHFNLESSPLYNRIYELKKVKVIEERECERERESDCNNHFFIGFKRADNIHEEIHILL